MLFSTVYKRETKHPVIGSELSWHNVLLGLNTKGHGFILLLVYSYFFFCSGEFILLDGEGADGVEKLLKIRINFT